MKKFLALFVSLVLLISISVLPVSAEMPSDITVPTVYLEGQGTRLVNGNGEAVYPISLPDGFILEKVKEFIPDFTKALITDRWDSYNEKLIDIVSPIYEQVRLDGNGNPQYGTEIVPYLLRPSKESLIQSVSNSGGHYAINTFFYRMDWRLDPFVNADRIDEYISEIKEITGCNKVNLVGRCEGTNVIAAYLDKYGCTDINCVELYVSTLNGMDCVSALFSGNLCVDSDSLMRFTGGLLPATDDTMYELISALISVIQTSDIIKVTGMSLDKIMKKVGEKVLPECIFASYGTFPGIWSVVNADEYKKARDAVFKNHKEEYAQLISQLDSYDTRVRQRVNELLLKAKEDGAKIAVYAKYDDCSLKIPLCEENNAIHDNSLSLTKATFGATCGMYKTELSKRYIKKLISNGKEEFLSPDKKVDASTCLFPDTTWIIYNVEHEDFIESIHTLMAKFLASNGEMTVYSEESSPRFLSRVEGKDEIVPMTEENGMETDENAFASDFKLFNYGIKEFVLRVVRLCTAVIKAIFSKQPDVA